MTTPARAHLLHVLTRVVDALESHLPALKGRDRREPGRKEKEQAEERLAVIMRRIFKKQQEKVLAELESKYQDRKSIPVEHSVNCFGMIDVKASAPRLPDLDDDEDLGDLIAELIRAVQGGIALFGQASKPQIDWTLTNKEAAQAAREYAYELVGGINDTTRDALSNAVTSFVETPGMTLGDLEERVSAWFGPERAENISITEVTRAYASGQQAAGEALRAEFPDVRVVKIWMTNNDDLVCEICGPLDGKEVEIDGSFDGDIDNPPAHPNCRCWTETTTALGDLGEGQDIRGELVEDNEPREYPGGEEDARVFQATAEELTRLNKRDLEWYEGLTPDQKKAVWEWSRIGYDRIRGNIKFGRIDKETLDFLTAVQKAPSTNLTTWRGIDDRSFGSGDHSVEIFNKWSRAVGTEMSWELPSSASVSPMTAKEFAPRKNGVIFEIISDRGKYINSATALGGPNSAEPTKDEMEVIVPMGTRFVVESVFKGKYDVTLEERLTVILRDITDVQ